MPMWVWHGRQIVRLLPTGRPGPLQLLLTAICRFLFAKWIWPQIIRVTIWEMRITTLLFFYSELYTFCTANFYGSKHRSMLDCAFVCWIIHAFAHARCMVGTDYRSSHVVVYTKLHWISCPCFCTSDYSWNKLVVDWPAVQRIRSFHSRPCPSIDSSIHVCI